jgi:hypothetical protein
VKGLEENFPPELTWAHSYSPLELSFLLLGLWKVFAVCPGCVVFRIHEMLGGDQPIPLLSQRYPGRTRTRSSAH